MAKEGSGDQPKPAVDLTAQLREAVFVVQVDQGENAWPLANAVAIRNDTLLTTAREAEQLATYRAKGLKLSITRPAKDFKEEVQDIRINSVYDALAAKNVPDWIYYDIGLLTVRAGLTTVASLATVEDLADVGSGMPVTCIGHLHKCEQITRFNKNEFEPGLASGRIFAISELPEPREPSGRARLLHVRAEIPKGTCIGGSPVVNAAGHVLGLYAEAAAPLDGAANVPKDLHYVTMVSQQMIGLWLQNHDANTWPAAKAVAAVQKTQSQP